MAKKYQKISLQEVAKLLDSPIHEHRFTGLVILVEKYKKANIKDKKEIYQFYLDHLHAVNNWDLVDTSAPYIVGDYLLEHHENRELLYKLAKSNDLWERRVSILATFAFIKNSDFKDALAISQILVDDSHDLIHKAVGWMLREIGKKDQSVEEKFLNKHAATMPRTMLRYAIEKFDEPQRQYYLGRRDSK